MQALAYAAFAPRETPELLFGAKPRRVSAGRFNSAPPVDAPLFWQSAGKLPPTSELQTAEMLRLTEAIREALERILAALKVEEAREEEKAAGQGRQSDSGEAERFVSIASAASVLDALLLRDHHFCAQLHSIALKQRFPRERESDPSAEGGDGEDGAERKAPKAVQSVSALWDVYLAHLREALALLSRAILRQQDSWKALSTTDALLIAQSLLRLNGCLDTPRRALVSILNWAEDGSGAVPFVALSSDALHCAGNEDSCCVCLFKRRSSLGLRHRPLGCESSVRRSALSPSCFKRL